MNIPKELKDKIDNALAGIKQFYQEIKGSPEPKPETLETKEGKTLNFTGELIAGVEVKLGDQAIEDGTVELKDGRKAEFKEGKFVQFAEQPDPIKVLESKVDAQNKTIEAYQAKFEKVIEANGKVLETLEAIATALEAEPKEPKGGSDEGEGMSKAEFVVAQAKRK